MTETIGILHPGDMGITLAFAARNSGQAVLWASEGRSPETLARATSQGLVDAHTLTELCQKCAVILSICPPHAADEVSRQVVEAGFQGLYVDANAISPQRVTSMAEMMTEHGISFVDGSVIGGPAWGHGTILYLSGQEALRVADCFLAGPLRTELIGEQPGRASALKMCYGAYTKGSRAMLLGILGTAQSLGVRDVLEQQWERDDPNLLKQNTQRLGRVTAKAWRFEGEMKEIATTFARAGLPDGFHLAAADIYGRLADFKGREVAPELAEVLSALLDVKEQGGKD
jgi:3-hydroxyisobutyrate dehydrogenase-like beta-hydroxyacid dehydrogenase